MAILATVRLAKAKSLTPTPEWLVYASGKTAREDGESGDEVPQ